MCVCALKGRRGTSYRFDERFKYLIYLIIRCVVFRTGEGAESSERLEIEGNKREKEIQNPSKGLEVYLGKLSIGLSEIRSITRMGEAFISIFLVQMN